MTSGRLRRSRTASATRTIRVIDAFVEVLDLEALDCDGVHPEGTGRPD
jgi:hypothetical protein